MADTSFGVNHPLARKAWSKMLAAEAITDSYFGRFIPKETVTTKAGKAITRPKVGDKSGLVVLHNDLKKDAGDRIRCGLRVQLQGDGVLGDATLEGNEEGLDFYSDDILIDQLRHAVRVGGKMTEQRVPYNLREESKNGLRDWFAARFDTAAFNQLCGYTPATNLKYTGQNVVLAPTANRYIAASGSGDNDEDLGSSHTFTLDLIDYAVEKATTTSIEAGTGAKIRPLRVNGQDMYVMFLHPYQKTQLRTAAGGRWFDIQRAALEGGEDRGKNPIFNGAIGVYNNVVLHDTDRVTQGVNSSSGAAIPTVRRSIFCGAQALGMAFGGASADGNFEWNEQTFDYDNQFGVKAGSIFGMKKLRFSPEGGTGEDFGTIVVSSYATASA